MDIAFQDQMVGNHCWGCSPTNASGLHIKSFWSGDESVCTWNPGGHHSAAAAHILNGGIIASIIDCHCICTAIANAYRHEGRPIGSAPAIWYATASLHVSYQSPTPTDGPVTLRARVTEMTAKRMNLSCSLSSGEEKRVTAELVAVQVPIEWLASR